jgi:hypothetical protein
MTGASVAFDDWVARARAARIEDEIARRNVKLRANGRAEQCGACPKCGGDDRFSINVRKQIFNCRGCDVGGDVIRLVEHLDGAKFLEACERLIRVGQIARAELVCLGTRGQFRSAETGLRHSTLIVGETLEPGVFRCAPPHDQRHSSKPPRLHEMLSGTSRSADVGGRGVTDLADELERIDGLGRRHRQ